MTRYILCGNLIDGTGQAPVSDAVVRVEDGSIAAIDRRGAVEIPSGADIIDLSDYTVVPGLIDCHDHLGIDLGDEAAQAQDPIAWITLRAAKNARALLAAGITTLRNVGEKDHIDILWRQAIAEGLLTGPRLLVSGQFISRTGGHGWYYGRQADGPFAWRQAVREQVRAGADFIKIMVTGGVGTEGSDPLAPDCTREEVVAAVDEAHRNGRKVAVHCHGGPAARWSIEAGVASIEHGVWLTDDDLASMAEHGVFLTITAGVILEAAESNEVPDDFRAKARAASEVYAETIAKARQHGVKVAIGGDTYHADPGSEMDVLTQAGYTPMEALQAATRNGAELCGRSDLGTLEVDKRADLVALAGNPLDAISAIRQVRSVVKDGVVQNV